MKKIPKQEYTAGFKEQAVKRAQEVGVGTAAGELYIAIFYNRRHLHSSLGYCSPSLIFSMPQ